MFSLYFWFPTSWGSGAFLFRKLIGDPQELHRLCCHNQFPVSFTFFSKVIESKRSHSRPFEALSATGGCNVSRLSKINFYLKKKGVGIRCWDYTVVNVVFCFK